MNDGERPDPDGGMQAEKMRPTWAAEPAAELRRMGAKITKIEWERDQLRRNLDDLRDTISGWKWDNKGGVGRCRLTATDSGDQRTHRLLTNFLEHKL